MWPTVGRATVCGRRRLGRQRGAHAWLQRSAKTREGRAASPEGRRHRRRPRAASQPSPWRSRFRCSSSTRVRSVDSAMNRTSTSLVRFGIGLDLPVRADVTTNDAPGSSGSYSRMRAELALAAVHTSVVNVDRPRAATSEDRLSSDLHLRRYVPGRLETLPERPSVKTEKARSDRCLNNDRGLGLKSPTLVCWTSSTHLLLDRPPCRPLGLGPRSGRDRSEECPSLGVDLVDAARPGRPVYHAERSSAPSGAGRRRAG